MKIVQIGIDLGNSMLKAATYKKGEAVKVKLPNRIRFDKNVNPKAKVLTIDGKTIYLGIGDLNNNVLKHTRTNLLEQTLVMINELYPEENNIKVDLKLGLPPEQLFNDVFLKEYQDKFPIGKDLDFTIDKKSKKVNINSIEVNAEGYSGFVHIVDDIDEKQDILSIDVGGGTIDLCNYIYDYEDEMYYPDVTCTIEQGVIPYAEEIAKLFNNTHGADIDQRQIDNILKNNLEYIDYKGATYPIRDYLKALNPMVSSALNTITNKYGTLDKYIVVGMGGGYKTFNRIAKDHISKQIEIDEETQFYANALGYLEQ